MQQSKIIKELWRTPFSPHPVLRGADAQTIAAALIPRRMRLLKQLAEPRLFAVAPGIQVLGRCSWQPDRRRRPTVILVHGLEGSADSPYMIGTGEKAVAAGFNLIRLNVRNCGGTEHLSSQIYHAGLTSDLRQVISELIQKDGLEELYIAGFSLGGNIVLKLAGEYGKSIPREIHGVAAVSPSLHLKSCVEAIELRRNLFYHRRFLRSMTRRLSLMARLFPDRYDVSRLRTVYSIRQFDNLYTAPHCGFNDALDYYERASALPFVASIAVPALIIHAKDDPFIPFAPFEMEQVSANPYITLLAPERGGHVGFLSSRGESTDLFWAERKIVEYVSLLRSAE